MLFPESAETQNRESCKVAGCGLQPLFPTKVVIEHHGAVRQRVGLVVSQVRSERDSIDFLLYGINTQGGEGAINRTVLVFVHHVDGSSIARKRHLSKHQHVVLLRTVAFVALVGILAMDMTKEVAHLFQVLNFREVTLDADVVFACLILVFSLHGRLVLYGIDDVRYHKGILIVGGIGTGILFTENRRVAK